MGRPRFVEAKQLRFITRRCLLRQFFLRPTKRVNRAVSYLFALGCKRYRLRPISVCFMSNHYHAVVYDEYGRYPAFLQWFHAMLAKALNLEHGRRDRFWDCGRTHVAAFGGAADVLRTVVYVLVNPVAAGLVSHGDDWPGMRSSPGACAAKPLVVERPDSEFFEGPAWPATVELRMHVPPTHAHLTPAQFAKLVKDEVAAKEAELRAKAAAAKRSFRGSKAVVRQSWKSCPKTEEAFRQPAPQVVAADKAQREGMLELLATFVAEQDAALKAFRDGDREVVFPYGTWLMVQRYNVAVHPPPCA